MARKPESVIPPMKPCETLVIRLRGKYYQVMITDDGEAEDQPAEVASEEGTLIIAGGSGAHPLYHRSANLAFLMAPVWPV